MWPSTSKLEKVAKDNGRIWTGSNSRNLTEHEMISSISMLPDRYRLFLEKYPSLALIGGTPLFRVRVPEIPENGAKIFAKAEWTNPGGSIKDRPVLRMILEAVLCGELTPDRTILDSSSGNAGIAYAMIGSMMGYRVELVVPGNASEERKKRIRAHGATLVETDPLEGYDAALRAAHRRAQAQPERYFMPDQYANDNNWRAHYETTAEEILEQTGGRITHFVAGIGTGGTITGVGRRLKEHDPKIQVVCVMPESFPGIEGLKPLEGPEDIVPKILDPSVIDRRIKVTVEDAYTHCRSLARQAVFVGLSSGAYLRGALEVACESPTARVVTIFSDLGERYFSTNLWDL
jgi:S-sulfo-L-cysteine synthase (O-acetyl-L-serine-dependent)